MNREGVMAFLDALGASNVQDGDEWIKCSCPLAPWLHAKGTDKHPSFGIKVEEDGPSGWYCFTCDLGGRLQRLVHAIHFNSMEYPSEAAAVIWDEEIFDPALELRIVRRHPKVLSVPKIYFPVPEDILEKYPLARTHEQVLAYLVGERRISLKSIAEYELRVYKKEDGTLGVIFPIVDKKGRVLDMYVRMIGEKSFFRLNAELTESTIEYKCTSLLFGEQWIQRKRYLWLVEAPLDALRLRTIGIHNVGATCGPPKESQIRNIYNPVGVILALDNDKAGKKYTRKIIQQIKTPTLVTVDWGDIGKKDANDVDSIEQVRKVLQSRTVIW